MNRCEEGETREEFTEDELDALSGLVSSMCGTKSLVRRVGWRSIADKLDRMRCYAYKGNGVPEMPIAGESDYAVHGKLGGLGGPDWSNRKPFAVAALGDGDIRFLRNQANNARNREVAHRYTEIADKIEVIKNQADALAVKMGWK